MMSVYSSPCRSTQGNVNITVRKGLNFSKINTAKVGQREGSLDELGTNSIWGSGMAQW